MKITLTDENGKSIQIDITDEELEEKFNNQETALIDGEDE